MKRVRDIPLGQWKEDVEHHRQAGGLGAGLEVAQGAGAALARGLYGYPVTCPAQGEFF